MPEDVVERNWFFRLSRYAERPRRARHVRAPGDHAGRRTATRCSRSSAAGSHDISVSRSVHRARGWGIPVPDDDEQVVYVWFDALAELHQRARLRRRGPCRPTTSGGPAPTAASTSSARASCASTPCTGRRSCSRPGEPLPTEIHVHPYLTVDGAKLSKSAGATVDPLDVVARYGTDRVRWWLVRDTAAVADTDFTPDRLAAAPTRTSPTASATSSTASPRSSTAAATAPCRARRC